MSWRFAGRRNNAINMFDLDEELGESTMSGEEGGESHGHQHANGRKRKRDAQAASNPEGGPQNQSGRGPGASRDGVSVEVFDDLGTDFDPSDVLNRIGAIRTVRVPCPFPGDEEESKLDDELKASAEMCDDFDPNRCPLCDIGDDGLTDYTRAGLRQVYDMEDNLFLRVSDSKLRKLKMTEFNRTVYENNKRMGASGVRKWTEYDVKKHERSCDRRKFERRIWRNIEFLQSQMDFLRGKAIFERVVVGNMPVEGMEMNYKASTHWCRLMKEQGDQIKLLKEILDGEKAKAAGKGAKNSKDAKQEQGGHINSKRSIFFTEYT